MGRDGFCMRVLDLCWGDSFDEVVMGDNIK